MLVPQEDLGRSQVTPWDSQFFPSCSVLHSSGERKGHGALGFQLCLRGSDGDRGKANSCSPMSQESTLNSSHEEGLWDLCQIKDN